MTRLRLLKLQNLRPSQGLGYLSNKLKYLEWDRYPFRSLPSTFQPDELIELHMRRSNMEKLWKGIKPLKMLKVIDVSYSTNLLKTIDFNEVPNLESLNLEGCTKLFEVHQSIGVLERLVSLNLKDCTSLAKLLDSICSLKSLKFLNLPKLAKLIERLGDMISIEKLNMRGIATSQPPATKLWEFLLPSRFLPWKNQSPSVTLCSLSVLRSLRPLDLSYCNLSDGALSNDLSCFPLLKTFNLSKNDFLSIPSGISRLSNLQEFQFTDCKRLQSFPNLPSIILYLSVDGCSLLQNLRLRSVSKQFKLENLSVKNCKRLELLPDLASTVLHVSLDGLTSQETHTAESSSLILLNCLKLIEVQSEDTSSFLRLTSYLHYFLRHNSSQGLHNPKSQISMC